MDGCILLARSILDSEVFASQKMLKIWVWCLCKANYKDRFVSLKVGKGERSIKVKRGQFIFGRFKAEDDLFIDGSTIYKIIKKLEVLEQITIQSNNQYSIITICNYDAYQSMSTYEVTSKEQPSNNQVTSEEQQSNTDKKDIKDNKDKKITLHTSLKCDFIDYVKHLKEIDYYWAAKDATAMKQIINKLQDSISKKEEIDKKEISDEKTQAAFRYMLENINDDWILDNFSMTIINSKYNEIIAKIKNNGKGTRKKNWLDRNLES